MRLEPSRSTPRRPRLGPLAALVLALPWALSEGLALWRARRRLGRPGG